MSESEETAEGVSDEMVEEIREGQREDSEPFEPAEEDEALDGEGEGESVLPSWLVNRLPPEMRSILGTMQEENGIAKVMMQPTYPAEDGTPLVSQAELVADIFNILSLDTKALAEAVGVDISITKMTPESAALKLQGLVKGEDPSLMHKFNELETQREEVLLALTDEETVAEHQETKRRVSYDVAKREAHREETDDADD